MFTPIVWLFCIMGSFGLATISLQCAEEIDANEKPPQPVTTPTNSEVTNLSENEWHNMQLEDSALGSFLLSDLESARTWIVASAVMADSDQRGFRVVPSVVRPIGTSESERQVILKTNLFNANNSASLRTGSDSETMEFSMLESVVYWGRLHVQGRIPGESVPEAVLRELGKGKAGVKQVNVPRLLVNIIPSGDVELPKCTAVVSPTRLEESIKDAATVNASFGPNVEVLRFEEICLPHRDDDDRRHIRRVVFIGVEVASDRVLEKFLKELSNQQPEKRKAAVNEINDSDMVGYVLGEIKTRITFVK